MGNYLKNCRNAEQAARINVGDKVRIIKTGKIGTVTKKIEYDREHQGYYSPNGYTTIQVECEGHKNNYAGRSLELVMDK